MPSEIRRHAASFVFQPVEADVGQAEIQAALGPIIARAPICIRVPSIWLDGPARVGVFIVRFDFMRRDWGEEAAAEARSRLDELVEMGFLTAREEEGAVRYTPTEFGRTSLRGSFGDMRAPSYCAPSEQRATRVISAEHGDFPCGSLRVRFEHVADGWPSWAGSAAAQRHVTAAGLAPGVTGQATVSLSRRWYSSEALPEGFANGSLGSLCREGVGDRYQGSDLRLLGPSGEEAAPAPTEIESAPLDPPLR